MIKKDTTTPDKTPPMPLYIKTLPIFNNDESIYAYELSIDERNFAKNLYESEEDRQKFAESISKLDMEKLVSQKPTLYHFHNNFLLGDAVGYIQHKINVKIDHTFPINDDTIKICRGLKRDGYSVFLDDVQAYKELTPLAAFSNIIFFNWKNYFNSEKGIYNKNDLNMLLDRVKALHCKVLATNIDTFDEYERARHFGVNYFQGDFYLQQLPISWGKLKRINLLAEMWDPNNDLDDVHRILQHETFMVNKMFLFINSPAFDLAHKINSLQHLVSLLGKKEVVRIVTLISLAEMSVDRPGKIFSTAMMRGRFAEIIAKAIGQKDKSDLFFVMSTFTLLDAFLDVPMDYVFYHLAISNTLQEMMMMPSFNEVSELVIAYERGDWMAVDLFRIRLKLEKDVLLQAYEDATSWTRLLEILFWEQAAAATAPSPAHTATATSIRR